MSADIGSSLSKKLEQCKAVCIEVGAPLVHAGIHGILDGCYLDLDEASFFSLLPHEKPSAVFYQTISYDPWRLIRGRLMANGWEERYESRRESIWPTPDEIKSELSLEFSHVESQIGLPRSLMMTYSIHGQHRVCWLSAEWAEELSEKIDEIIEARYEREEEARDKVAVTLESLIVEVANDPEFKAIRGRPKKLLFLQKKYGERIPRHPRGKMAKPAQNCDYVDENISIVLVKADDIAWASENLE